MNTSQLRVEHDPQTNVRVTYYNDNSIACHYPDIHTIIFNSQILSPESEQCKQIMISDAKANKLKIRYMNLV